MNDFNKCSDYFNKCSDCGIERTKPPVPGTCPCCFSEMVERQTIGTTVFTCTRNDCRRVCTSGHLSGFWSGWREKERQVIQEIKNTSIPKISDEKHPPSWWAQSFGGAILYELLTVLKNLIDRIETKE